MKWPRRRRKQLVLTLGETYELGFYTNREPRQSVVLTEFSIDTGGWITARFVPDPHD